MKNEVWMMGLGGPWCRERESVCGDGYMDVNEWIWKTWDGINGMGSRMMTLCMKERLKGWRSDYAWRVHG